MKMPLVLLHGWGVNSAVWEQIIPTLQQQNFQPTIIDLPGYGNDLNYAGDYTLDAIVAEVLSRAPETALWVGWSLGATIAMAAAMAEPHRFIKLQLISPSPHFPKTPDWNHGVGMDAFESFARDFGNDYEKAMRKFLLLQVLTSDRSKIGDARALIRELSQRLLAHGQPTTQTLDGGLDILRQTDFRNRLHEIAVETQVVAGQNDHVIPVEASQYVFDNLPTRHSIHLFEAGHLSFLQEPGKYMEALTNFANPEQ